MTQEEKTKRWIIRKALISTYGRDLTKNMVYDRFKKISQKEIDLTIQELIDERKIDLLEHGIIKPHDYSIASNYARSCNIAIAIGLVLCVGGISGASANFDRDHTQAIVGLLFLFIGIGLVVLGLVRRRLFK